MRDFNVAGVLEAADVHVAQRITELAKEPDEAVALAVALVVRALRGGSVCVDLSTVAADCGAPELPWPEPVPWLAAVRASRLTREPPVLRLYDDRLLYLDRYWREEEPGLRRPARAVGATAAPVEVPDPRAALPAGL